MFTSRRLAKFVPALALVALAVPSSAFGQATRTWVSGVGDDVNPCSRTAPCKTFAGAISKTAAHGEINALDPGGYGSVTITKSITIRGRGTQASLLISGTPAVTVNAGVNDKIVLANLSLQGLGTGGTSGVRFMAGKSLRVQDTDIQGFNTAGVNIQSSTPNSRVYITD